MLESIAKNKLMISFRICIDPQQGFAFKNIIKIKIKTKQFFILNIML